MDDGAREAEWVLNNLGEMISEFYEGFFFLFFFRSSGLFFQIILDAITFVTASESGCIYINARCGVKKKEKRIQLPLEAITVKNTY